MVGTPVTMSVEQVVDLILTGFLSPDQFSNGNVFLAALNERYERERICALSAFAAARSLEDLFKQLNSAAVLST